VLESSRSALSALAERIGEERLRGLYTRMLDALGSFSGSLDAEVSAVEARFLYRGRFLCRIVPYREIIHIQIGDSPTWETRIRDDSGWAQALDRLFERFLEIYAGRA
jgi:hypothetical protein